MEIRSLSTIPKIQIAKNELTSPRKDLGDNISKAVANNKLSASYIDTKAEKKDVKEVRRENLEASEADVRDVEKAAELAEKVSYNILNFEQVAKEAHNPVKEKVWSLLE